MLESLYERDSRDANSLILIGSCHLLVGDYDKAMAAFHKVLNVRMLRQEALCGMAEAQRLSKQHERALKSICETIKIAPMNAFAHEQLGQMLLRRKEYELAATEFERVLALSPDRVQPRIMLGLIYLRQNRLSQAVAVYEEAIGLRPDATRACYLLATAYAKLERYQEALVACEQGLASPCIGPNSDLRLLYGVCALQLNRPSLALKQYHALVRVGSSTEAAQLLKFIQVK